MTKMNLVFDIESLVTVHYFEYSKDYLFPGESHDFWEFLYVDKGEVTVHADENTVLLHRGEMIFHKPGEFHTVIANGVVAPNLVVVSFVCRSDAMEFYSRRVLSLNEENKKHIGRIVAEARNAFSDGLSDPNAKVLVRRENAKFGCEQLLMAHLQILLVNLVRQQSASAAITSTIRQHYNNDIFTQVTEYMEQNLGQDLTLDSLAAHFSVSRTSLKSIFREHTEVGIMEYLRRLRIERAKQLIREEAMNFTSISEELGFSSIHYFSRVFKKYVGMSPSEYATSVKILVEWGG